MMAANEPALGRSEEVSMEEVISVERIISAVDAILNASTPPTTRTEAHHLCERVKMHSQAYEYGFQLVRVEVPLSARLFGLNVLEEWVKSRLDLKVIERVRDGIWGLLGVVVAVGPNERRLMQEKAANLVAQLALRIWPQYWPDFFTRILDLVVKEMRELEQDASAVIRTEMGLRMAKLMVEEVHPRESAAGAGGSEVKRLMWDDTRRPELQQAISIVLPILLSRMYTLLPLIGQWNGNLLEVMRPLVEVLLEAFASVSLVAPLETDQFISSVLAVINIIKNSSSSSSSLTSTGLDTLSTLFSRNFKPNELTGLLPLLFDSIIDPIRDLFGHFATLAGVDIEKYDYMKRLEDSFVTFCGNHLSTHQRKQAIIPTKIDLILDVIIQLSNFPSLLISSHVTGTFWSPVSRTEKLMTHKAFVDRLPSIFLLCLVSLAADRQVERRRRPFNSHDFDENEDESAEADFEVLYTAHFNRLVEIIRQCALYHPQLMTQYCGSALETFWREKSSLVVGGALDPAGLRQYTSLMYSIEAVLRSCLIHLNKDISSQETNDLAVKEAAKNQVEALAAILCNSYTDPASQMHVDVLYEWLLPIRSLVSCLGVMGSPSFLPLLQTLFTLFLSYTIPPNQSISPDRRDSMQTAIRAKSGSNLRRISAANPRLLLPATDYILDLYRKGAVGKESREQTIFVDLLLSIAGCIEDGGQRGELVRMILQPQLTALQQLSSLTSNWQTFIISAGYSTLIDPNNNPNGPSYSDPNAVEVRKFIHCTNSVLFSTLSHLKKLIIAPEVKQLIIQYAPSIHSSLFQALIAVMSIFDARQFQTEKWAQVCGDLKFAGADGSADETSSTSASFVDPDKALDANQMSESFEMQQSKGINGWIQMFRITVFMSYGQLGSLVPSHLSSQIKVDNEGSVGLLKLLSNHYIGFTITHWMLLIKHSLLPLILSLNDANNNLMICHELLAFVLDNFGLSRLENEWNVFDNQSSNTNNTVTPSATSVNEESNRENLLNSATNTLLTLLIEILIPVQERDRKVDPVLEVCHIKNPSNLVITDGALSPLARSITHHPILSVKILTVLANVLRWRSNLYTHKVINIVARWLPVFMSNVECHSLLFGPILGSLLNTLMNSSLVECHGQVVNLLNEIFKWHEMIGYNAFEPHLSAILGPNTITQSIQRFYSTPVSHTVKAQRTFLRTNLVRPLQQCGLVAAGITTVVPRLPDRLVVMKKLKKVDEDIALDVAGLFD